MTAEAVERDSIPVTLHPVEAQRLAATVRGMVGAASGVLSGGRRLTAEDLAALRRGTAQLAAVVYNIDDEPSAKVIDLDRERYRRRR